MLFSELIGQKETRKQLVHMVLDNRLSHALLFLGKEGSGALPLARALAQFIVCERVNGKNNAGAAPAGLFDEPEPVAAIEPKDLTDSCGVCSACMKASKMIHPDIHFSFPVIPKKPGDKPVSTDYINQWREFQTTQPYGNNYDWLQFIGAENRQGNITSDECNEIIRQMGLKSFEAGYKILIMWMPEMLGKEGNKLLKLIEEPPPGTLFLLVAENEAMILPTIISRTQLVKVPMLSQIEIEAALELREGISIEKAETVAMISEGNYREALLQLQHAEDDWEVMLRDWLNSILRTGPQAQLKWIEEISKIGREKQKQFLKYFNHLLEQAIRSRSMGKLGGTSSSSDFAERLNKLCDIGQQEAIVNELEQASYYIERNANAKMLFHALTIKIYHIISNKTVILMQ
jgi:DNA polymerase III subunit delta'